MKSILASWMQALPSEPHSHGVGDIIARWPIRAEKPKNVTLRFLKKNFFFSLIEVVRVPRLMLLY